MMGELLSNPSPLAGEGQLAQRAGGGGAASAVLLERAKWMRQNPTEAERRLWSILRAKRLSGFKFKRQQVIDWYIVDFVNFEHRLIVEADGSQHAESAADAERDSWLRGQGFVVLRYWNNDILACSDVVADAIWHALLAPTPLPAASRLPLSRKGRGDQERS
jgi:very-short-patch-repair endonuclease